MYQKKEGPTGSNLSSKTWDQQTLNTKPERIARDKQIIYPQSNETANKGFLKIRICVHVCVCTCTAFVKSYGEK